MTTDYEALALALLPITSRVRRDVTAIKKEGGVQAWTKQELTLERMTRHLNGGPARGVCPILEGQSVTLLGLLDFDSHGGETPWYGMTRAALDVMESIELMGGSPIAFRSSGGRGIHVYVLWDQPQDAYSVRQWLIAALRSCGYESGTKGVQAREIEVFPKQDSVPVGGYGNQFVLALAGQSVPLVFEELSGDLVPVEREAVLDMRWPVSEPVPVLVKPERPVKAAGDVTGYEELRELLDAIPNAGGDALAYDAWRNVIFAIHHETGGSEDGRALAHEFSAKSSKYDEAFLDSRVWPYIDSQRGAVVGVGTLRHLAAKFGWTPKLDESDFEEIEDERPPSRIVWDNNAPTFDLEQAEWDNSVHKPTPEEAEAVEWDNSTGPGPAPVVTPPAPPPQRPISRAKRRGSIPEAHFLTTDQANAQRLRASFGSLVFVSAGKWHTWDGRRWLANEADVYRYGCRLSDIVRTEARSFGAKAEAEETAGNSAEATKMRKISEALSKWALKCEMKGTIEAAIGLMRKMLTVDAEALDRDPWALNCLNGIVDLRTGAIRKHDPEEYITKLVPLRYRPEATCPTWERVLPEITCESGLEASKRPLAEFLQRWFGYCLTGHTREQCFVVHWGGGSNGKSTVLLMMDETSGDYAGTAAPGLLAASRGERHPTEIASLFGRRTVTAHESGEGVVLREDFVKQATGGDRITARYMREDFFTFEPTHKIQLLTNHKPQIKGQDMGIWRRVKLVPYLAAFGTAEQIAEGDGKWTAQKDEHMSERLRAELEGILAWRVRGAVAWSQWGLAEPDVVRAASEAYKHEQDRIGHFVNECCEEGRDYEEALTEGMGGGLYPAYTSWCKESGIAPLSKLRFMDDLLRVVPRGRFVERKAQAEDGKRKNRRIFVGARLLVD